MVEGFLVAALIWLWWYWKSRRSAVYLWDFQVFYPPESWHFPTTRFLQTYKDNWNFSQDDIDFAHRLLDKSGLGETTSFPPAMHTSCPGQNNLTNARKEIEQVVFPIVEELLKRHDLHPWRIDCLVVNCSLLNTTPSLASMIIHRFGMCHDIESYNLAGMGCSASILALRLAAKLISQQSTPKLALVVSTESITMSVYTGSDRSMQIQNVLFRVGASAALLTNSYQPGCVMKLLHTVRTHTGGMSEASYRSVFQDIDQEGKCGVRLSKDIVQVASQAMEINLKQMARWILPWSEKLRYWRMKDKKNFEMKWNQYLDYFCIHTGGRAILDSVQKSLKLTDENMEPSRHTLSRMGNTSSSSIFYELDFILKKQYKTDKNTVSAKTKKKKNSLLLMLGFGAGFKVNSAIWEFC